MGSGRLTGLGRHAEVGAGDLDHAGLEAVSPDAPVRDLVAVFQLGPAVSPAATGVAGVHVRLWSTSQCLRSTDCRLRETLSKPVGDKTYRLRRAPSLSLSRSRNTMPSPVLGRVNAKLPSTVP